MAQSEFEFSPVPKQEEKSTITLSLIWLGYVIVIGSTLVGGGLASGLNLRDTIWVVYLGCIILSIIASGCSIVAHKTGLSFSLVIKAIFGTHASRIVTILLPIIFAFWYAINTSLLGEILAKKLGWGSTAEGVLTVGSGLLMIVTAYWGIRALGTLSRFSNVIIIGLAALAIYHGLRVYQGSLSSLFGGPSLMPYTTALEIVIGSWVLGSIVVSMDLMRFSRSTASSIISASVGLLIGTAPSILIGAFTARAVSNPNPIEMLFDIGSIFWFTAALILLFLNVWDTNDENLYSAGLSFVNIKERRSEVISRKRAVVLIGICASFLTLLRPHRIPVLFSYFSLLGKIIPPLAGIIFAHYAISRQRKLSFGYNANRKWNATPLIAWLVGSLVAYAPDILGKPGISVGWLQLGSINGLLVGALVYYILEMVRARAVGGKTME